MSFESGAIWAAILLHGTVSAVLVTETGSLKDPPDGSTSYVSTWNNRFLVGGSH